MKLEVEECYVSLNQTVFVVEWHAWRLRPDAYTWRGLWYLVVYESPRGRQGEHEKPTRGFGPSI